MLQGLLNDLNIYQHFDHFSIPKYVTSTGRLFSRPFFLQLQGNKLARAFIIFKKQKALQDSDYATIKELFSNRFPKQEAPCLDSRTQFTTQARGLFNNYVKALVKQNTNLNLYPNTGTLQEQLLYILNS